MRNVGFLALLQGPHYTVSAHTEANRNLLQSEYNTPFPLYFPNAVTFTLWGKPKALLNATLPVRHTAPENSRFSFLAKPSCGSTDTTIAELQETGLRRPWGPSPALPAYRQE